MFKGLLLALITIFFIACDSKTAFSEYKSIKNSWKKDEKIQFTFQPKDTINSYDIFINIRNDENYPFSNLFLIAEINFPNGKTIIDTLTYQMAKPNGEWLGKGLTSIKENKLWYKENIIFSNFGSYTISIEHAMRKNGEVEGVQNLTGITDVGISVERTIK